jgi:hypothetical protein
MTEHRPKYIGTEVPVCAVCQDWWPCPHAEVAVTEPKPTPAAAVEAAADALTRMEWHARAVPQSADGVHRLQLPAYEIVRVVLDAALPLIADEFAAAIDDELRKWGDGSSHDHGLLKAIEIFREQFRTGGA